MNTIENLSPETTKVMAGELATRGQSTTLSCDEAAALNASLPDAIKADITRRREDWIEKAGILGVCAIILAIAGMCVPNASAAIAFAALPTIAMILPIVMVVRTSASDADTGKIAAETLVAKRAARVRENAELVIA